MEIIHYAQALHRYVGEAVKVSGASPVLLDSYLQDAIEVDVDAIADGTDVYVAGVMEHIEEAGIHSGDSACSLPPHSLDDETVAELDRQTTILARALKVIGLMNVQYAVKDGAIYIIEVNPRASRTVPFVAKATGAPIAKIAARVMAGEMLAGLAPAARPRLAHVAVKEAVFPFARFSRRRRHLRPGNEVDRRGHGNGRRFPARLRQVATGHRHSPAPVGHGLYFRSRTGTSRSRFVWRGV